MLKPVPIVCAAAVAFAAAFGLATAVAPSEAELSSERTQAARVAHINASRQAREQATKRGRAEALQGGREQGRRSGTHAGRRQGDRVLAQRRLVQKQKRAAAAAIKKAAAAEAGCDGYAAGFLLPDGTCLPPPEPSSGPATLEQCGPGWHPVGVTGACAPD